MDEELGRLVRKRGSGFERSKSQWKQRNKWSNALKVETYGSREERQTDEAKTGKRRQTKSHAVWPGRSMKVKDGKNSRRKKEMLNGQTNSGSADEANGIKVGFLQGDVEHEKRTHGTGS